MSDPRPPRHSERLRTPQPLIKHRVASGRGAMEQPNVTNEEAVLNRRFWALLVTTGVCAGLFGDLMMLLLFTVERTAFGYHSGPLEVGVEHASDVRRLVVLLVGGVVGGVAWYLLRRFTPGEPSEVDDVLWHGDGKLSFRRSLGTSVISEVVVGMGASIGREAAPKLLGGASASFLACRFDLTLAQRRLLVACGAGAGLAAVYNVPLGGALFTAEILVGAIALPVVLPALVCSATATLVAWIYLPTHATYLQIPDYHLRAGLMVWSVIAGVVVGFLAIGYIRLIGWVSAHRPTGVRAIGAPAVAFGILGLIGFHYPQLFGNGKDLAHDAFVGAGSLTLFLALGLLKPFVTSLCLGSGASGGLFTPVLSTGAALGAFGGLAWSHLWAGSPVGAYAEIGAAAMLAAGMQAPLAALALVLELTRSGYGLMVPMVTATAIATAISRHIDGYSIYSARLPKDT